MSKEGLAMAGPAVTDAITRLNLSGPRSNILRKPEMLPPAEIAAAVRLVVDYDSAAIQALTAAIIHHDSAFSTTHLFRLLAMSNLKVRANLAQQAIAGSWSTKRVREEIQGRQGRRRANVGRNSSTPKTRKAVLMALHRQIESWRK
ncbi:hypothetical protein BH11PLA2_BH11PLA2_38110 [soil metagenome]